MYDVETEFTILHSLGNFVKWSARSLELKSSDNSFVDVEWDLVAFPSQTWRSK